MKQVVSLRILCFGALIALGNLSQAQGTKPSIENFRFTPAKVCMGDAVQYAFSYRNVRGGLAAVNAAEMSAQRPGEPPRRAVFVLTEGERQKHTAESGSFESWTWYWPALQARAPKEGIDIFGSMNRFRQMHAPVGVEFAAYMALYPVCRYSFIDDQQVSDRPIRVFHGTADDQQLAAWCRNYVAKLRAQGKDIEVTEYPGAHHNFDNPILPPSQRLPDTPNLSRCFLVERQLGELINRESGKPPSADDACRSRGVTHGYHPSAHAESVRAINELLTRIFRLDAK